MSRSRLIGPVACVAVCVCFLAIRFPAAPAQNAPRYPAIDAKKHADYLEKLSAKQSLDMVAIPGGTFVMGTPATEKGRDANEGPQHPVTIQPFWMAKFETTWDIYDLFSQQPGNAIRTPDRKPRTDGVTGPTPTYGDPTYYHPHDGHPALCMTHHAAMEFCRWLSFKTNKPYRLPTEAEWEWACRAGTTTAFSFGDDATKLGEYAWFGDNADDHPHKVGSKKANPWGLFDMHGNVAEWCLDSYEKDYSKYPIDRPTLEPFVAPTAKRFSNVARGGSWSQLAEKCRSGVRDHSVPDWIRQDPNRPQSVWWLTDADMVGFRVICPVEEVEGVKGIRSKVTFESPDS
jgi:formylglycine-generating enzyme required for sulfatase activity